MEGLENDSLFELENDSQWNDLHFEPGHQIMQTSSCDTTPQHVQGVDDQLGLFPDSCSLDTGPDAVPAAEYPTTRGDPLQRIAELIFDQLGTGSPGGLEVYDGNLSYTVNTKRNLASSDETELQSKLTSSTNKTPGQGSQLSPAAMSRIRAP